MSLCLNLFCLFKRMGGRGAESHNLNLFMKTLRRARIGTSTEESLVCVPVLIAHICWSLKSCDVKDLISLMGLTILLAISWGRAMAELVLLCPVCPVCKAAGGGGGVGGNDFGAHRCAD